MTEYNNFKLSDLQNLEVRVKYANGKESFITKYGQKPFGVGRLINPSKPPYEEGNFEARFYKEGENGAKGTMGEWKAFYWDKEKFQSQYSWAVSSGGTEGYLKLTYSQNLGLTDAIKGKEGAVVIPKKETVDGKSRYVWKNVTPATAEEAAEVFEEPVAPPVNFTDKSDTELPF